MKEAMLENTRISRRGSPGSTRTADTFHFEEIVLDLLLAIGYARRRRRMRTWGWLAFSTTGRFPHVELTEISFSGPKCDLQRKAEFQVDLSQHPKSLSIRKLLDGDRVGCGIEPV
jgi:hypothetical protein